MPIEVHEGLPIFVENFGEGERTVLGIHGTLGHSGNFRKLATELHGNAKVISFDLPGHGQSADWDESVDFCLLSLQIANSILGEEPMDVVGHSYGGLVALSLAMHRPDAVRSLTLVEPILYAALKGTELWDEHHVKVKPILDAIAAGDQEKAVNAFMRQWGGTGYWDQLPEDKREAISRNVRFIKAAENFCHTDVLLQEGALESLEMPVIVVYGTETMPDMPVICENIAARMPDVGVATVEGAEHNVLMTHPAQLAGLVEVNFSRS